MRVLMRQNSAGGSGVGHAADAIPWRAAAVSAVLARCAGVPGRGVPNLPPAATCCTLATFWRHRLRHSLFLKRYNGITRYYTAAFSGPILRNGSSSHLKQTLGPSCHGVCGLVLARPVPVPALFRSARRDALITCAAPSGRKRNAWAFRLAGYLLPLKELHRSFTKPVGELSRTRVPPPAFGAAQALGIPVGVTRIRCILAGRCGSTLSLPAFMGQRLNGTQDQIWHVRTNEYVGNSELLRFPSGRHMLQADYWFLDVVGSVFSSSAPAIGYGQDVYVAAGHRDAISAPVSFFYLGTDGHFSYCAGVAWRDSRR